MKHHCQDGKPLCRDRNQHYRAIKNDHSEHRGTAKGRLEFITDVKNLAEDCDEGSGVKNIGGYKWQLKLGKPGPNVCVYLLCEHGLNNFICKADVTFTLIGKKEYCYKCRYECSGENLSCVYKCVFPIKYKYVTDTSHGLVDSKGKILIRADIYENCYEHPNGFTDSLQRKDNVKNVEAALSKMDASMKYFKKFFGAFASLECDLASSYAKNFEELAVSMKNLENILAETMPDSMPGKGSKNWSSGKHSSDSAGSFHASEPKLFVAEVQDGLILFTSNIDKWILPLMQCSSKVQVAKAEWCLVVEMKVNVVSAYLHCKSLLSNSVFEVAYKLILRHIFDQDLVKEGIAVFDKSTNRTPFIPLVEINDLLNSENGWINYEREASIQLKFLVKRKTSSPV